MSCFAVEIPFWTSTAFLVTGCAGCLTALRPVNPIVGDVMVCLYQALPPMQDDIILEVLSVIAWNI